MSKVSTQDLTADDLYLFAEGTHGRLASKLGAHVRPDGTSFAVWAPNAERVSVIGDFNGWDPLANPMQPSEAGVWHVRVPEAKHGNVYKYRVVSGTGGHSADKADPYAFRSETPPRTGSMVWDLGYQWGDEIPIGLFWKRDDLASLDELEPVLEEGGPIARRPLGIDAETAKSLVRELM